MGGTVAIAEHYGVPIVGPHIGDKFWLDALMQQSQMFGFPPAQPFAPNEWLNDNDTISVGNLTLDVLHCPGHTPGHVVLVERSSNRVIVGDVIFAGSIGRTDFPQGNHQQLIDSIKQKIMVLPDDMTIYPGHGPTTTVATEKPRILMYLAGSVSLIKNKGEVRLSAIPPRLLAYLTPATYKLEAISNRPYQLMLTLPRSLPDALAAQVPGLSENAQSFISGSGSGSVAKVASGSTKAKSKTDDGRTLKTVIKHLGLINPLMPCTTCSAILTIAENQS